MIDMAYRTTQSKSDFVVDFAADRRLRLLDLFCGAGGAGFGYHRAGFDVVGVDIAPQPDYPFAFIQNDALSLDLGIFEEFDAIHASPPCQAHSAISAVSGRADTHIDLIPETRDLLAGLGRPWVIENVVGAPLERPVLLCGTMFGLGIERAEIRRHRLFETNWSVGLTPQCQHRLPTMTVTGSTAQRNVERNKVRETFSADEARSAMGMAWTGMRGLSQAIPPAYTEWLGRRLLSLLSTRKSNSTKTAFGAEQS